MVVKMNIKRYLIKIKMTIKPETWCCAIRINKDENTSVFNDLSNPFLILPNTKNYWCADPFLFKKDNQYYAFFEVLDLLKRKGMIGYRTISENGYGDIHIIYECDIHLSFPYIYEENGEIYIIPESAHANELFRLKCIRFPDTWEKDKVLIKDKLVDTVRVQRNERVYYLSQRVDDSNTFDRVDVFYEENGQIKECFGNPQKNDSSNARGAGSCFYLNGRLIRPTQDCSVAYGDKLKFNEVLQLDENVFSEKLLKTISYQDIPLNQDNTFSGIHTYNKLDNFEIIDLKIPSKFNMRNTIGAVIKIFRSVFH